MPICIVCRPAERRKTKDERRKSLAGFPVILIFGFVSFFSTLYANVNTDSDVKTASQP